MSSGSFQLVFPRRIMNFSSKEHAYFTPYHLLAAETSTLTAVEIENKYKSVPEPPKDAIDLCLSQVSMTIMSAVGAIESNINEYLVDKKALIDSFPKISNRTILDKFNISPKKALSTQLLLKTNCLAKCNIIWFIKHSVLLPDEKRKNDLEYLIALRHAVTHFTPEWHNELIKHAELKRDHNGRFTFSPFFIPNVLFFPYEYLSASCATWAVASAKDFIEYFDSSISR